MKTLLAAMAAVAAVTAAAPALAQPYGYDAPRQERDWRYEQQNNRRYNDGRYRDDANRYDSGRYESGRYGGGGGEWNSVDRRQGELIRRIEMGERRGDLSHWEAERLRQEFREIARIEARYRENGISRGEMYALNDRLNRLEMRIHAERRDRDYGYGYGERDHSEWR